MWMRSQRHTTRTRKARKAEFGFERTAIQNFESGCDDEKRCFSGVTYGFWQVAHIPKFGFHLRFPEK